MFPKSSLMFTRIPEAILLITVGPRHHVSSAWQTYRLSDFLDLLFATKITKTRRQSSVVSVQTSTRQRFMKTVTEYFENDSNDSESKIACSIQRKVFC